MELKKRSEFGLYKMVIFLEGHLLGISFLEKRL